MYGMPDYCIVQFADGSPLHPGIVELNIEKSRIRYIKSFLELEGNPATVGDILMLTTGSFKELNFSTSLTRRHIEDIYAMDRAMALLEESYTQVLTPQHIFRYNFAVLTGVRKEFAGRLRSTDVTIGGTSYRPPQFELLERLFENMFSAISLVDGHINKAISYLLAISKNQVFIDGNKRTARLVALHQLSYGNQKVLSSEIDTHNYILHLKEFYELGDAKPFADFF